MEGEGILERGVRAAEGKDGEEGTHKKVQL